MSEQTYTLDEVPRAADFNGDDEMWTLNIWVKPGQAPEICDQIRALEGVAELYRAYRPGHRS